MRRRRLTVVVAMAVMLASAGMAQAQPIADAADARCMNLARQTLGGFGADFNPANTTFVGGTEGNDVLTGTEGRRDVVCGFGGGDRIETLEEGDIFLGGEGNDGVRINNGTFYGGEGHDYVFDSNEGTFYGGAEIDIVRTNNGTFYGGAGEDVVIVNNGTFYGGEGDDRVGTNNGTFYGDEGYDDVGTNTGTFEQD